MCSCISYGRYDSLVVATTKKPQVHLLKTVAETDSTGAGETTEDTTSAAESDTTNAAESDTGVAESVEETAAE